MTEPYSGGKPAVRADRQGRVLPRRFYTDVAASAEGATWQLLLDGRKAMTPGKRPLAVPDAAIGERLAVEWSAQGAHIDPATMPVTTLVCTALDAVAQQADSVAADIVKYAGSDLLCYRAEAPAGLVAAQGALWDPVLAWAARDLGARVIVADGLMPVVQPAETSARIAAAVGRRDPLSLAALHVLTTLTGSTLLALAIDRRYLTFEEAWRAAHVDEDWQIAQWGEDAEAIARRAHRFAEAHAAAFVLQALTVSSGTP
jgi:chaperone required for assembly of F1-ATPase